MATQIRDYLRNRGLKDEEITYNNGTVFGKGRRIIDATPSADGKTYAEANALDNAYNNFDTQNQIDQLRTRANTPNPQMADLQQTIRDRINKPAAQFSYNAEADPQYQASLRQAQRNSQTASGNIAADMNKRGLLNSTVTQDRGNQAAQAEYGRVSDTVLPQLISQAYQRFQGQQQQDNAQTGQMFQLAGMYDNQDQQQYGRLAQTLGLQQGYNQQQFANQQTTDQAARQKQQDHIALAQALQDRYGVHVNPTEDPSQSYAQVEGLTPLAMQQYLQQKAAQEAGITGMYNDQPTMAKQGQDFSQSAENRRIALSAQGQAQSASNASASQSLAERKFQFDKEQASNKTPKVEPNVVYAEVIGELDAMTLDQRKAFLKGEKQSLVRDIGITGYNALYGQYFDKDGEPIQ